MDFSDAKRAGRLITGINQVLHWRQCDIWVYKAGTPGNPVDISTSKPIEKYAICDGKGTVPWGIELLVRGSAGKYKEVT